MDKLAYHYNKKKRPAKTEGKFLYYYPCDTSDNPNVWFGNKPYVVVEVTEAEWEALFELDRLEYNSEHAYTRHNTRISDRDEDKFTPKEREKRIDKEIPFNVLADSRIDRERRMQSLPAHERDIAELCLDKEKTQKEVAEIFGVSQSFVSTTLKSAKEKLDDEYGADSTRDDIVWRYWNMFVEKGEMPGFLDVQLEYVIRQLLGDMLPFLHWFYSLGELCRYIIKAYCFDADKAESEIAKYLNTVPEGEREHYNEYYGDKPNLVGAVYIRLTKEMQRRQASHLQDSDKLYNSLYSAVEKVTKRLNVTPYEFLTQRFYPFIAKRRNKRLKQFYRAVTGKKLEI